MNASMAVPLNLIGDALRERIDARLRDALSGWTRS